MHQPAEEFMRVDQIQESEQIIEQVKHISRYANIDLTAIIERLNLPDDEARQEVENAFKKSQKRGKLDEWIRRSAQREFKAECDVELETQTDQSSYVQSAKPEVRTVVQSTDDKKPGKQKFVRANVPLDAIHKLCLA